MKYAYEDLSPEQFEELVVRICRQLLGFAVQPFATGPDGGRDARFEGRAERIPSSADPWEGRVVVQAKHTIGINRTFSDTDFSGDAQSSLMRVEAGKLVALIERGELDHYVLFSNRRMSALGEEKVRSIVTSATGLPSRSVHLVGVEGIELLLKDLPHITDDLPLSPVNAPLIIRPEDLSTVVEAIANTWDADSRLRPPEPRQSYEAKNTANGLDPDFAKEWRGRYLRYTKQISDFLADPRNATIRARYDDAAEEIGLKALAHDDGESFAKLMMEAQDQMIQRDPILAANKKLTRSLMFFMYWSCDIGRTVDAET